MYILHLILIICLENAKKKRHEGERNKLVCNILKACIYNDSRIIGIQCFVKQERLVLLLNVLFHVIMTGKCMLGIVKSPKN